MHTSTLWRRGLAALVTAGLLFSAATAQDEPLKERPIKTDAQYPVVERDPFVNQMDKTHVFTWKDGHRIDQPLSQRPDTDPIEEPTVEPLEPVAVDAPSVTVTGIVSVNGQRQAIINSSHGSRIIHVGQQLADYRVSEISSQAVTFTYSGQDFEIPLESEF